MIKIQNITKFYANFKAVSNLSFNINFGELVGFIGPNGAGKTTTLKCITTLCKPSNGNIVIEGVDTIENPNHIRNIIGYLPEENPLINELTVKEYLNFRLSLKNHNSCDFRNIAECIKITDIEDVQNKLISKLSKGYRQRIGIAESLLGNPKILILDEPINGLDPEQIINIRNLLLSLKTKHTLIVSSHILSELELICDKYLIISKGELKFFGTYNDLIAKSGKSKNIIIECDKIENKLINDLQAHEAVKNLIILKNSNIMQISVKNNFSDPRPYLYNIIKQTSSVILKMDLITPSLENIYMELISA